MKKLPVWTIVGIPMLTVLVFTTSALANNLKNPPPTSCARIEGENSLSDKVRKQLIYLERIIYNWKNTHTAILGTLIDININNNQKITPEIVNQVKTQLNTLNDLTLLLDKETRNLETIATKEKNLLGNLTETIITHKSSSLLFLQFFLGESDFSLEEVGSEYDKTWISFAHSWNAIYALYGCSSMNPWVTY